MASDVYRYIPLDTRFKSLDDFNRDYASSTFNNLVRYGKSCPRQIGYAFYVSLLA